MGAHAIELTGYHPQRKVKDPAYLHYMYKYSIWYIANKYA